MINKLKASKTYFNLNYDIDLEENKNIYCFIGVNGVGKTKLLETMCKGLIFSHEIFSENSNILNFRNNITISEDLKKQTLRLPLNISLNNENIRDNLEWSYFDLLNCHSKNKIIYSSPFKFIGAKNRGHNPNFDKDNIKLLGSKIDRFSKHLKTTIDTLNNKETISTSIADWFVSRIIGNTGLVVDGHKAHNEIIHLCNILKELDKETFETLININNNSSATMSIFLKDGKLFFNNIPFESLPSGYMGVLKIVQDIIDTYGSWELNKPLSYSSEAIIFIDEIEAHLHPKWESKIIPLLKRNFPKATFYITTHSPTIVGSTREGESYELINDNGTVEARKLGDPRSWYLADVYSQAFHLEEFLSEREESKEDKINEFKEFSNYVKKYLKSRDLETLEIAKKLGLSLEKSLPNDDPRLITLNNLKSLLK